MLIMTATTKLTHLLNPSDQSLAAAADVVTCLTFGDGLYALCGGLDDDSLMRPSKCIPLLIISTSIYSLYVKDEA